MPLSSWSRRLSLSRFRQCFRHHSLRAVALRPSLASSADGLEAGFALEAAGSLEPVGDVRAMRRTPALPAVALTAGRAKAAGDLVAVWILPKKAAGPAAQGGCGRKSSLQDYKEAHEVHRKGAERSLLRCPAHHSLRRLTTLPRRSLPPGVCA